MIHFCLVCQLTHLSDDPWNQTAADNAEWLQRFKNWAGVADNDGPGLSSTLAWALEQGGSGFAPPYLFPRGRCGQFEDDIQVSMGEGAKPIPTQKTLANNYLQDMIYRYPQPGSVFCSRELEQGLIDMAEKHFTKTGALPSDEAMQSRAKEIVSMETTAADDPMLLGKFKTMMLEKLGQAPAQPDVSSALPTNMDVNISDEEVENMLQDMQFELTNDSWYQAGQQEGSEDVGGVMLH